MMEGEKDIPLRIMKKYVNYHAQGNMIFREGDQGTEMYCVLKGRVSIRKGEVEIGVAPEGKCFGEMSFLLSSPRVVTAVALDDVELVAISNENINILMIEDPAFVVEMLRDIAKRMRAMNEVVD